MSEIILMIQMVGLLVKLIFEFNTVQSSVIYYLIKTKYRFIEHEIGCMVWLCVKRV